MSRTGFRSGDLRELLGFSYKQIEYYDRTSIVKPDLSQANGPGSRRIYSRSNLQELNVVRKLLGLKLPLSMIRKAIIGASKIFKDVKQPLLNLQFYSDGIHIFASHKDQHDLYDLLEKQPVLSATVEQVSQKLEATIHKIEVEHVETIRADGKIYLVELLEDTDGDTIARCPDMFGISARGENQKTAMMALGKQIKAAAELLLN
jgi:DNA-binding transcriptional MerR regulator